MGGLEANKRRQCGWTSTQRTWNDIHIETFRPLSHYENNTQDWVLSEQCTTSLLSGFTFSVDPSS
jgi:hypothetical protein